MRLEDHLDFCKDLMMRKNPPHKLKSTVNFLNKRIQKQKSKSVSASITSLQQVILQEEEEDKDAYDQEQQEEH